MIKKYIFILLLMLCSCMENAKPPQIEQSNWEYNVDAAMFKAKRSNKLVLLYFYGNGCEWCELMNANLNNKRIKSLLDERFVVVWIDVEKSELARMAGISTVPTMVVVVPNSGEPVGSMVGYLNAKNFEHFIKSSEQKAYDLKVSNIYKNLQ